MISEKQMEDAIAANPDKFLEPGLKLIARQYRIGGYIFDLLFEDRRGAKLIVEIQKGTLDRNHTYKILDYYDEYKSKNPGEFVDLMIVCNKITAERRQRLSSYGISWQEVSVDSFACNIASDPVNTICNEKNAMKSTEKTNASSGSKDFSILLSLMPLDKVEAIKKTVEVVVALNQEFDYNVYSRGEAVCVQLIPSVGKARNFFAMKKKEGNCLLYLDEKHARKHGLKYATDGIYLSVSKSVFQGLDAKKIALLVNDAILFRRSKYAL